jgi:hypothetical protein
MDTSHITMDQSPLMWMDSTPSLAVPSTFPVTENPVLDSVNPELGSFGIDNSETFDPFQEFDDTNFEIYTMDGDTSLASSELFPVTIVLIRTVQGQLQLTPCTALLDTRSNSSWIHERVLPAGATPSLEKACTCQTTAGLFTSNRHVRLEDLILPDFGRTHTIDFQSAHVFSSDCCYDLILGRDFLKIMGMEFDFEHDTMEWSPIVRPVQPSSLVGGVSPVQMRKMLFIEAFDRDNENDNDNDGSFTSSGDNKCKRTTISD